MTVQERPPLTSLLASTEAKFEVILLIYSNVLYVVEKAKKSIILPVKYFFQQILDFGFFSFF